MPQPFRGAHVWNDQVLVDRPHLAVSMMRVLSRWAIVEKELATLLCCATGEFLADDHIWSSVRLNQVAEPAMDATVSLATRLDIMERALQTALNDELMNEWRTVRKSIRSTSKERNRIAHAMIYCDQSDTDSVVLISTSALDQPMKYTSHDFERIMNRIDALVERIDELRRRAIDSCSKSSSDLRDDV